MKISFRACEFTEIGDFIGQYVDSLSSPIDSYLEGHILRSQLYVISIDDIPRGYCGIHKSGLLTQYFIQQSHRSLAQEVLRRLKAEFLVSEALVPTCDEFFLSHLLDDYRAVKVQAYFFRDDPDFDGSHLIRSDVDYRPAVAADAGAIKEVSGDFLDQLESRIERGEIHVGYSRGDLAAIGVAERQRILTQYASVGMFTNAPYRLQRVGRSTILYLKNLCYAADLTPLAGCAHSNLPSKKTLESAGMYTATRLLRFTLKK